MSERRYRIRVGGEEHGPFTEERIRGWIRDRTLTSDPQVDGWLDESSGTWRPFGDRFATVRAESGPSLFDGITVHSTYYRVTKAGIFLFCFWALVFGGIRLWTGRWPGQGGRPHHNRVIAEELPKQEYREPRYPSPWDTPAIQAENPPGNGPELVLPEQVTSVQDTAAFH